METAPLSVIHSILAGEDLIAKVLDHYPIPSPRRCLLYKRGLNDTYFVETAEERYILRVYRRGWRTREEIDFELEILMFLHHQNMPVSYPIQNQDGALTEGIATPEGERYAALFSYAPGQPVMGEISGVQSQNLGEAIATIHQVSNNFYGSFKKSSLNMEYLLERSLETIKPLFNHRVNDIDTLQRQIATLKSQLEALKLPDRAPAYGICMGDLHAGNAHFTDRNEPTLFDFDQCGYGWRAFDIGKFIHTAKVRGIDNTVRARFLDGYQTIRQLSAAELASVPIFVKVAHIWLMGIHTSVAGDVLGYERFNDSWLDEKLASLNQFDRHDNT